jgi:hypothetical protein
MSLPVKRLLLIGVLLCTICFDTIAQHLPEYQLKEIQAFQSTEKLGHLLFISAGVSSDRIFSGNLYQALKYCLKKSGVTITYQFSFINYSDVSIDLKPDTGVSYDAVLLLLPDSLSEFSITFKERLDIGSFLAEAIFYPAAPMYNQYNRRMRYHQHFSLGLYNFKRGQNNQPQWLASLQINFDPTRNDVPGKIARDMIGKWFKDGKCH